jgi:predicted  nucleic acid-binding Zn-ribbon protein
MKKIVILALLLAGCQSTVPTTRLQVITPPDQMYDCPIKEKWPNWQHLNDTDVAKTIVELYKNNKRCKNSIDAIQKFLTDAKARIED